jgi:hypothetical protein
MLEMSSQVGVKICGVMQNYAKLFWNVLTPGRSWRCFSRENIQTSCGALPASCFLGTWVKKPGREADHSPLSNAEIKNEWRYTFEMWTGTTVRFYHGV